MRGLPRAGLRGADDLRAQVEETYNALREHLGFKRRDLESTVGSDGLGFIRTPAFDFTVGSRLLSIVASQIMSSGTPLRRKVRRMASR